MRKPNENKKKCNRRTRRTREGKWEGRYGERKEKSGFKGEREL